MRGSFHYSLEYVEVISILMDLSGGSLCLLLCADNFFVLLLWPRMRAEKAISVEVNKMGGVIGCPYFGFIRNLFQETFKRATVWKGRHKNQPC